MSKRKQLFAGLLVATILGGVVVVRWRSSAVTAEPVFKLVYGARNNPIDGVPRVPLPNKGYQHASVAINQSGDFYMLAGRRDTTSKIPGVPASVAAERVAEYVRAQQNIVHVLVVNASGQIERAVPLRRLDGRLVRGYCDFLSVSASGERWWTLRQAHESLEDWKDRDEVKKRTVLLNAYDGRGKPLGEWSVSAGLADEGYHLAAYKKEAYLSLEGMESQLLVYRPDQQRPQQRPNPGLWLPSIAGSIVTVDGQFWHLLPENSGNVKAYVTESGKSSREFATFQWHRKGTSPFLFWANARDGLFVFEQLYEYEPSSTPPRKIREDGAKAVYHIAPTGQVQKLFETPDVLKAKAGEKVRTGQLLKADANFVWMEVEYFKGNKVTEYQIVKVPY